MVWNKVYAIIQQADLIQIISEFQYHNLYNEPTNLQVILFNKSN